MSIRLHKKKEVKIMVISNLVEKQIYSACKSGDSVIAQGTSRVMLFYSLNSHKVDGGSGFEKSSSAHSQCRPV